MKNLLISCIILALFGTSCSTSEPEDNNNLDSSRPFSIVARVNGEKFETPNKWNIIAEYKKLKNNFYKLGFVSWTEANGDNEYRRILVAVYLPGPTYFTEDLGIIASEETSFSNPLCYYDIVDSDTGLELEHSTTELTRISSFRITELDTVNKIMSGTFKFTSASTIFARTYEVKEGVFNKIKYKDVTEN